VDRRVLAVSRASVESRVPTGLREVSAIQESSASLGCLARLVLQVNVELLDLRDPSVILAVQATLDHQVNQGRLETVDEKDLLVCYTESFSMF